MISQGHSGLSKQKTQRVNWSDFNFKNFGWAVGPSKIGGVGVAKRRQYAVQRSSLKHTQANSLSCPFFFLLIPRLTQLDQSENPIPQPPPPAVSASGPRCWNAPPPFAAAAGPAPFGRQRKCHATCRGLEGFGGEGIESIEVVGNGIY